MELKHDEISFRLIAGAVPVALVLINCEEKIIYQNDFAEKMFSYNKNELIGQNIENLLPDLHRVKPPEFWDNYFTYPENLLFNNTDDFKALKKTGKRFPVEVIMNPLEMGENIYVLLTISDVSERIRANEQFRLVFESAPNAMILTDSTGKVAMVNKQTELLFGYDRNEIIGNKIEILVPHRLKQNHPEHRKKFYEHPKARPMGAGRDLYGVKKDGTEIPVEIGLNPVEKDGAQFVLASVIDITERKKNEEAISLYAQQIEKKNQELEEFTNIASHDLREPLNSIISLTEILKQGKSAQLDDEGIKLLGYIEKSSSRMNELIIGLLDYARLGNSKELLLTDLNQLLENVLHDLDSSIKKSGAKIQVGILPAINVYVMEMRLLFQNLISNALKYKKPDVTPWIEVSAKRVSMGWEFAVVDNGIGIPQTQKEMVFNLFHRVHRKKIGRAHV